MCGRRGRGTPWAQPASGAAGAGRCWPRGSSRRGPCCLCLSLPRGCSCDGRGWGGPRSVSGHFCLRTFGFAKGKRVTCPQPPPVPDTPPPEYKWVFLTTRLLYVWIYISYIQYIYNFLHLYIFMYMRVHIYTHTGMICATSMQPRAKRHIGVFFTWREHDFLHDTTLPAQTETLETIFSATSLPASETLGDGPLETSL